MGVTVEPLKLYRCSILLIFEKLMTRSAPRFPEDLAVRMPSLD